MNNNFKTFALLAGLTALVVGAGQALGGRQGLLLGVTLAVGMNAFAYWFSDKLALASSGAQLVTDAEAPELVFMIRTLTMRAQLPMPRVYVTPAMEPNAFATGRDPEHAAVAVTQGLLRTLGGQELEGVLAHELAHIKNRDILLSSVAAALAGVLTQLATMAQWAMIFGRSDDEEGGSFVGDLAMMIVAPIVATLVQLAISRSREFEADRVGAQICGRPLALASALEKLERGLWAHPMRQADPALAHMYIANPFGGMDGFRSMFSTHPSMEERVQRLRAQAMGIS